MILQKFKKIFFLLIIFSFSFSQSSYVNRSSLVSNQISFSNEPYVTGEDGMVRMYVNIIGHVRYPGTYLVYEGIDILSLLSLAGGPLEGAKLSSIKQYNNDMVVNIDLESVLRDGNNLEFELYPHNTIYVKQSMSSYLFSNTSLINSTLQVLNIFLTIFKVN